MFDDIANQIGSWLTGDGEESAIVLSSRVRLARNIKELTYPPYAEASVRENVVNFVAAAIGKSTELSQGTFYRSEDINELDRFFLIERHLISPEFMRVESASGLYISPQEEAAIMVNEEDHLRIQSLCSGLSLRQALERAMKIDDDMAASLDFDYDTDFGFLTSCPTNVGTGMRASVLIHLAGLVLTKEIDSVIDHITKLGLVVRGFYGEGSDVWGNLFQVSNQTTLGRSENDIAESLEKVTTQIIEFENKARERLVADAENEIADKVWRAHGILKNARVLTSEETMSLLSAVRLGIALSIFDLVSIRTINELVLLSQPAHLQKHVGEQLDAAERDVARANLVRERLCNV
ncbi:MAG: protein arginine kinase [candidate division Zixibacteria bacterium]|nr:protein arginine kinase [candidate division Zixibacteria bacterium]